MKHAWIGLVTLSIWLAGAAPTEAQCEGTSGRVVDHLTGEPIVGAEVRGGQESHALTTEQGCFTLATVYTETCSPQLPDCAYSFGVTADGYASYDEYGYRPLPDISRFYADVRLAPLAATYCFGDCEQDHAVAIGELVCAVDALLSDAQSGCVCADRDGDERLNIAEVLTAVRNALLGCIDCGPLGPDACGPLFPED
jgi:hypothetical protein